MFIQDMLKEELENSLRIKADVEAALESVPPGALVKKVIHGHPYYYLAQRKGSKVSFAYLGKLNPEEIRKYEEAQKQRAGYRKQISELNKQVKYLQKATRGK
jgi:hypothetical protein